MALDPSKYKNGDIRQLAQDINTAFGTSITEEQLYAVFNGDYTVTGNKIKSLFDSANGKPFYTNPTDDKNVFVDPALNKGIAEMLGLYLNAMESELSTLLNNRLIGTFHLGYVGGTTQRTFNTFSRPNNSTAYIPYDIVSSDSYLLLTDAYLQNGGNGYLTGLRVVTNKSGLTPRLRIHLGQDTTFVDSFVDNDPMQISYTKLANRAYLGYIDLPAMVSTGTTGASYSQDNTQRVPIEGDANKNLYAVIETLDAFSPDANQTFSVKAFIEKN